MNSIFGYLALFGGIYCLYGYYKLKFKREITNALMITKDVNFKKCKDFQSYCKTIEMPILILSIILCVCGGIDLYYSHTGKAEMLSMFMIPVVLIALFYYSSCVKKANEKYF